MNLSFFPTFFLQMGALLSVHAKHEVDKRMQRRALVCKRLLEHGELDLVQSLRRCESMAVWIVALLACVGGVIGWLVREPWVGVTASLGGAAVGAWLAGVMVDNVHTLGRLVSESHEALARRVDQSMG